MAVAVAQNIIGLGAVAEPILEAHGDAVIDLPANILQHGIDLDARKSFRGLRH
jgi:hypothetical protein